MRPSDVLFLRIYEEGEAVAKKKDHEDPFLYKFHN